MAGMKIAVIGLGLIGGSFCKAISSKTPHKCYGYDISDDVLDMALSDGTVAGKATNENLPEMDIVIVCLYPFETIDFINKNADRFGDGCIVIDACGVKQAVLDDVEDYVKHKRFTFIGAHPMAGREFSGYKASSAELFCGAYLILTPTEKCQDEAISLVSNLARDIGFIDATVTTAEHHDKVIAFTSQLAHIASNAYVKSDTITQRKGFSAGSFKDLTRVARLNADMWTTLFLQNKEPLVSELETYIGNLELYLQALKQGDAETLRALLQNGTEIKEMDENSMC